MDGLRNKNYIIFTRSIMGIGGAEIYVRNKVRYLQNNNNVYVISSKIGDVKISELERFKSNIVVECVNDPFLYSKKQREKILLKILNILPLFKQGEEVIIESNYIQGSIWGELLAKELKARNFCLLVDDRFPVLSKSASNFFKYKLSRKELAGIHSKSLEMLFSNNYQPKEDEKYFLSFTCTNSIEDVPVTFNLAYDEYDFKIGTVSRLNKPCLSYIVDNIKSFSLKNPNLKILYVIFGGGNKQLENKFTKYFSSCSNVDFIITGEMFPVPLKTVQSFNLFINVAGAAWATTKAGVPTMTIDLYTGIPFGLLGFNTQDTQYSTCERLIEWKSIDDALTELLINKEIDIFQLKNNMKVQIQNVEFIQHDDFIISSCCKNPVCFYDFMNYEVSKKWFYVVSFIYAVFGFSCLDSMMKFYRRLGLKK